MARVGYLNDVAAIRVGHDIGMRRYRVDHTRGADSLETMLEALIRQASPVTTGT